MSKRYEAPPPYTRESSSPTYVLPSQVLHREREKKYYKTINNHYITPIKVKPRQKNYHGPVVNHENGVVKVTTEYYNKSKNTKTKNIVYVDKKLYNQNQPYTVSQNDLPRNIRIDGLAPVPVNIGGHLARDRYFEEQQRILGNKYTEKMLRLEAQRVYSHLY